MRRRRIACVVVPRLAVQAVLRERFGDGSVEEPVALVTGPAERLKISACSVLAEECGVRPGLSLAAARGACPDLVALTDEPEHALDTLEALAEALNVFGPVVSLALPDAVLIDVTGVRSPGTPTSGPPIPVSAGELVRAAHELGFSARAAVASTPFAARALAAFDRVGGAPPSPGRRSAPGGADLRHLPDERRAVEQLPLAAARLPAAAHHALRVLGIRTVGAFMALPVESITRRFGREARSRWREAHGLDVPELLPFHAERPVREQGMLDDHGVEDIDALCFRLRPLLERAVRRLVGRGEGAEEVTVELEVDAWTAPPVDLEDSPVVPPSASSRTHALALDLGHPSQDARLLLQLFRERIRSMPPTGPVTRLTVLVTRSASLDPVQLELFGDRPSPETMAATMARLAAILGNERFIPALREDYRPERAWEMTAFQSLRGGRAPRPGAALPPGPRPTRLLREPKPIRGLSGHPEEQPPPGARAGPERLVTGWWDGDPIARDYWVVSDRYGRRTWIFRDLPTGSWWLHGFFD